MTPDMTLPIGISFMLSISLRPIPGIRRQVLNYCTSVLGTKARLGDCYAERSVSGREYDINGETNMLRNFIATALTTTLLVSAAPVFAQTMVKEVVVTADMTAIENVKAASHWATLAEDLQNAITTRITDIIADDGVKVSVDIDAAELASSFQSSVGTAESKLMGKVNVFRESDQMNLDSYDLSVTFEQAGPFFLPETDLTKITTDSKEYYDAMIAAFADYVATKLKG